jgi:hypothetical protein
LLLVFLPQDFDFLSDFTRNFRALILAAGAHLVLFLSHRSNTRVLFFLLSSHGYFLSMFISCLIKYLLGENVVVIFFDSWLHHFMIFAVFSVSNPVLRVNSFSIVR